MPEYTSRPTQRRARIAWDYFMETFPWMKSTTRVLTLGYSPNLDLSGPGWYMTIGSLPDDLMAWKGHEQDYKYVYCGSLPS